MIRSIRGSIDQLSGTLRNRERSNAGGDSHSQNSQGYERQQKKDEEEQEKREYSAVEIDQAMNELTREEEALSNGLNVTSEGKGPGLRVTLKDGSGAVVRQMTGEEFMKLREAASNDAAKRGKILDQKV